MTEYLQVGWNRIPLPIDRDYRVGWWVVPGDFSGERLSVGYWQLGSEFFGPPVPRITGPTSARGVVGQPFSFQIAATRNPTAFHANVPPPAGLSVNAAGLISGTPSGPAGTTPVTVSADNAEGAGPPRTLNINIVTPTPPVISTTTITHTVNTAMNFQLQATNSPTSWSVTPAIPPPAGLTFNPANGRLTGTPTVLGTTTVAFTASNVFGPSAPQNVSINVQAAAPPAGAGYYGLLGANNTQPTWLPSGGTPDETTILGLVTDGGGVGVPGTVVASPASGNQWTVSGAATPGHFGWCFAYPATLPAASSLFNVGASAELLPGHSGQATVMVNGVNYRVYFQRTSMPSTAIIRCTIG